MYMYMCAYIYNYMYIYIYIYIHTYIHLLRKQRGLRLRLRPQQRAGRTEALLRASRARVRRGRRPGEGACGGPTGKQQAAECAPGCLAPAAVAGRRPSARRHLHRPADGLAARATPSRRPTPRTGAARAAAARGAAYALYYTIQYYTIL